MYQRSVAWPLVALHAVALLALASIAIWGSTDIGSSRPLDAILESGAWAIRFLLLCLAMTPLQTYLGWRGAARLRKPAGLWAFGFAALHAVLILAEISDWLMWLQQPFILLGLGSLLILTALAVTSNRWAMRWLGRAWKRLHRLVYLAGGATALHAILAAGASKRMAVRDPQAIHELQLYAALAALLLVVRVPLVRQRLQPAVARLRLLRGRAATVSAAPQPPAPPALPHLLPQEIVAVTLAIPAPLEPRLALHHRGTEGTETGEREEEGVAAAV